MIKNANWYKTYKTKLAALVEWGDTQLDKNPMFTPEDKENIKKWGSKKWGFKQNRKV